MCVNLYVFACASVCLCVSVNEGVCEESWAAAAVALAMSCDAPSSGGVWIQLASALPTLEFSTP